MCAYSQQYLFEEVKKKNELFSECSSYRKKEKIKQIRAQLPQELNTSKHTLAFQRVSGGFLQQR